MKFDQETKEGGKMPMAASWKLVTRLLGQQLDLVKTSIFWHRLAHYLGLGPSELSYDPSTSRLVG